MSRKIDYEKLGMQYIVGKKVVHLRSMERTGTQCGLHRLGLVTSGRDPSQTCKNCTRTIKVIRALGKRVAIFKTVGGEVESVVERD
ncbi:MAG: hypothetical protein EHM36_06615 [Deltaproteobacteria bacterium]|nr:MAG: hypothetical protein EHM36_06615 [Deltaproteobacteria bacterium]